MNTVHIAGLCLGGNKGGPAILKSLTDLLRADLNPLTVVLLSTDWESDLYWQDKYQVKLLPRPHNRNFWQWLSVYHQSDLAIDMHGVKFLGPSGLKSNISSAASVIFPRLFGVPTICFTQTYGPFVNRTTRLMAKITLGLANLLYAREQESVQNLRAIGLGQKAQLFPDVAIMLAPVPVSELICSSDVTEFVLDEKPFIGISLSTMVVRQEKRLAKPLRYQEQMTTFIQWLLDQNYRVLLIPHTYKPNAPDDDDLGLALKIYEDLLITSKQCLVVQDDLPPDQLKTLISKSHVFIGSRYHSLIAALSTGVPSLSVGWSHKYDGLLALFDMEQFSFWADKVQLETMQTAFQDLIKNRWEYSEKIKSRLPSIQMEITKSVKLVTSLLMKKI